MVGNLKTQSSIFGYNPKNREIHAGRWRWKLPVSRKLRIIVGIALIVGGILGFLPVLGFWMIPLGLLVLSSDIGWIRRHRRKLTVKWQKQKNGMVKNNSATKEK